MPFDILVSSSLGKSPHNSHILSAILEALNNYEKNISARYLDTDDVIESAGMSEFDLFLYVGSSFGRGLPLGSMGRLSRDCGKPSIFWATEDPYEFDMRFMADEYDIYFSNDLNSAEMFMERDNVFHLPLAAPITDLRPISPMCSRDIGLLFCGFPYENRKIVIEDLVNSPFFNPHEFIYSGPDVNITGLHSVGGFDTHSELIDAYNISQFAFNLGRTYGLANQNRQLTASTPGPRTFESAIAGCPQIYFGDSLEIEEYYTPGEELIKVEGVEELFEKMTWFKSRPESWEKLARAAQDRTRADHLYENRVSTFFTKLRDLGIL